MKNLIKNKKAQEIPGAFIVDIFSYIAFAVIAIIFFALFLIHGCSVQSQQEATIYALEQTLDLNTILTNVLKTPISIEGKTLTVADAGILALYDTKYDSLIQSQLEKAFNNLPHLYVLKITKGQRTRRFGAIGPLIETYGTGVSAIMPAQDFEIVEFEMYMITQKEIKEIAERLG